MRGENYNWMKVASHLKMTKQRAQAEMTSAEFVDWLVMLKEEWNTPTADQYYLAQIAREIAQIFSKKVISIESKILKWRIGDDKDSPELAKQKLEKSKSFWRSWADSAWQRVRDGVGMRARKMTINGLGSNHANNRT